MIPKVHVYAAPADKFYVNSFLVEAADAVILVDTQFLVSTARELSARIDALGKRLAAIIITHPHPDHFNGLPILLEGRTDVPVYANAATIEGIRATQAEKRAAWTPVYGEDYPKTDALPDHELAGDAELSIAGVDLHAIDLGASECRDNSIIHLPQIDALIASDLIYNGCHPWLAEHRTAAWLQTLDAVERRFSDVKNVYAGHGAPGGVELFDEQRQYIADFRKLVGGHAASGELDAEALARVAAETRRGRAGWPLEALIEMNAVAVAAELASPAA